MKSNVQFDASAQVQSSRRSLFIVIVIVVIIIIYYYYYYYYYYKKNFIHRLKKIDFLQIQEYEY